MIAHMLSMFTNCYTTALSWFVCGCNLFLASYIDTTVLADGTYELIPESEGGDQEAQVNATTLTEDPDQSPEEPKADLASDYREGKPRT